MEEKHLFLVFDKIGLILILSMNYHPIPLNIASSDMSSNVSQFSVDIWISTIASTRHIPVKKYNNSLLNNSELLVEKNLENHSWKILENT